MHASRRLLLAAFSAGLLATPLALPSVADSPTLTPATRAATPDLGHDRLGLRRGDAWFLRDSLDGGPTSRSYREHLSGWIPLAGDTDGDGGDSVSLFKDGIWLLRDQERGLPRVIRFGMPGDQPLLGDWNGDGTDTLGVFRAGRWHLLDANVPGPARVVGFGVAGDTAVPGDWDGDGDTDIAVRRGPRWFQRDSSTAGPAVRSFDWGMPGDIPLAGDWDHDGKDTPGLFRDGAWYFRAGSFPSPVQSTRYGMRGDWPIVRRTPSLAPGVQHRVVRNDAVPYTAHIASVILSAVSSPDTVLAQNRLRGLETVSVMARRSGAVLAVNGDYALSSGRPVHLFANNGVMAQTPQLLGRAMGLDARGTRVSMGFPDLQVKVSAGLDSARLTQVNSAVPSGRDLAAWTSFGEGLARPPAEYCYAGVRPAGGRTMDTSGAVRSPLSVTGVRCGGPAPLVPSSGAMLTAVRDPRDSAFLRSLRIGQSVEMTAQLGFPGAVDVIGGNPLLVNGGKVVDGDVDGSSDFFGRNPRTAVGVTGDGRLLLVTVDGRQGSYSAGATLRETAELMRSLGAVSALNLDGGGSTEMIVNGLVANRPSDGRERPVSSALTVLHGGDSGQAGLLAVPTGSLLTAVAPADGPRTAASTDPASTGGLADSLRRSGVRLPPDLAGAADAYARARR